MTTPVKVATSASAAASAGIVVVVGAAHETVARPQREDDLGVRWRQADDAFGQRLDGDLGALVVDDGDREGGLRVLRQRRGRQTENEGQARDGQDRGQQEAPGRSACRGLG